MTVDELEALARSRGISLPRDRLAAVLAEVNRLKAQAARLQALPLDAEEPALRLAAE